MAIANNISNNTEHKSLSIQISLNGLSFCILDIGSNTITHINQINFDKRATPLKLLDILKDQFELEPSLQEPFQSVQVIHDNDLATIIPKALFNENHIADYLKFNSKILKSDFIAYDDIESNNSVSVYVPYVNINNYIFEKFGDFTYKHISTVLINQILIDQSLEDSKGIYIHVSPENFQIIVIEKSKLVLYNTFEFHSKEDFIYYILFTLEQLQLDPETIPVTLIGNISKGDDLYNILYKYIRHVDFGNRSDRFNYKTKPKSAYANFTLIHSL